MSAFIAWAARHGVDVSDARDAQMTLRFDGADVANAAKAIGEGFRVWKDAGMPEERFRQARVRFSDGERGPGLAVPEHRVAPGLARGITIQYPEKQGYFCWFLVARAPIGVASVTVRSTSAEVSRLRIQPRG